MPHTRIEKMADMMKTRPGFFCFGCSFPSASCLDPCAVGRGVAGAVGVADGVGKPVKLVPQELSVVQEVQVELPALGL